MSETKISIKAGTTTTCQGKIRKFLCRIGLHDWMFDPVGAVFAWETDYMSCLACGKTKPATEQYYRQQYEKLASRTGSAIWTQLNRL